MLLGVFKEQCCLIEDYDNKITRYLVFFVMVKTNHAINILKYEHEYNQFFKMFTALCDVDKNNFFRFGGWMGCCMIYNKLIYRSFPFLQDNKHTENWLLRRMISNYGSLTLWYFRGSWCWYCSFLVKKISFDDVALEIKFSHKQL